MGAVMFGLLNLFRVRPRPESETCETRERAAIRHFWADPPGNVRKLIQLLDAGPAFNEVNARDFTSPSGLIRVCMDVFGPEVTIHPTRMLLDCHARAYGLSREEASDLYEAILRQVPASSTFRFRGVPNDAL